MTWTSFWYGVAEIFNFCFKIMKKLGHGPNIILWLIIIFLLAFWTLQIRKQNKEAERNGTYK